MQTLPNLLLIILISLSSTTSELVGQWSGALDMQGNKLNVIFHINQADDTYEATFDSPDQNIKSIPVSKVTFDFPDVKFESNAIGMVFEGNLRGDEIKGLWKQSGRVFEVTFTRDRTVDNK
ncbi:MAG: hypothetical protein ABI477_13755 [Chryseolinea sp.]